MSFQVEEAEKEFKVTYNNSIMHFPKYLYYSEQDTWVRVGEFSGVVTIGLTDYTSMIFEDTISIEFNVDVDSMVSPSEEIGVITTNKIEFKLFPPISGKIIAINSTIKDQPDLIKDNYEKGWLFKIDPSDLDAELRNLCINAKYYVKVLQERVEE